MSITLGDLVVRIKGEQAELDRDLSSAEGKVKGSADRMGGFFRGALQHTVGGAILGGVRAIGGAIGGAFSDAWDATKSYESVTASLNTLLTKEIQDQSVQTKRIAIGKRTIQVTEGAVAANYKKGESEADVAFKIAKTTNAIAVQNERLQEAIAKGKESGAEIEARRLRIQSLESSLAALNAKGGQAGTVTTKQVMAYREEKTAAIDIITARKMATEKTKELLQWSQKLAVQSPYSQEDVVNALKMGVTLGYNSDQAKRLTTANINFAAATGASGDAMSRITLALGQMQTKGKLMGGEMLQLTEAGVPMRQILVESGKVAGLTTENFAKLQEKGLIPAREAYEAYVEYMEKNFPRAAAEQGSTLAGLQNSFLDLRDIVLRTMIGPIFKAAQPAIQKVVDLMQKPSFMAAIERIGKGLGEFFGTGVGKVTRFFEIIDTNTNNGIRPIFALRTALQSILPPEFMPMINTAARAIDKFQTSFAWSKDAGFAIRQAIITAFGPNVEEMVGPIIGAVMGLPEKASNAFKLIKEGKWGELLNGLWGDLGLGAVNLGEAVSSLLARLGIEAQKEDTLKKAGDAFFGWGAAALRWIDEKISSEDFQTGLEGVAGKLGTAAGATVSSVASALGAWVAELAGFPAKATPEQMQTPLQTFVDAWVKMVGSQKDLGQRIGKAFWKQFFEGIGATAPTAEELAKLAMNPMGYAQEMGTRVGTNIRNTLTGQTPAQPQPNRFAALTKQDLIDPSLSAEEVAKVGAGMADGIKSSFKASLTAAPVNEFEAGIMGVINGIMVALGIQSPSTYTASAIGTPMAEGIGVGFTAGIPSIESAMRQIWAMLETVTAGWAGGFVKIGRNIIGGLIQGVKERAADFKEAILSVLPPAIRAVLAQMGIASPSKVTMGIGNNIMDGFIQPFERRAGEIKNAMSNMIQPMMQAPALGNLAAIGAGGGSSKTDIHVNMGGVTMANEMDGYSTAYRIAKRVKDGI
jgi:tape measure domain-containing protein